MDIRTNQNFDNRLLLDEHWQTPEEIVEYLQKFVAGDPILIQLTTNYDPDYITISLLNQDKSIDASAVFNRTVAYTYSDGSGLVVYNFLLDQSFVSYSGLKFVHIAATDPNQPTLNFLSESFEFGDYSWLPYFSWQGSDRDGIFWDDAGVTKFGFRAEVHRKYTAQSENSIYQGFNFQPETLFAVARRVMELTSDPLPRYVCEKLELAFKHYTTWVNGVSFSANGASAKIALIDYSNHYNFNLSVIEVEYEDYTALQEVSGQIIQNNYFLDYDNAIFDDFDDAYFVGQQ
jgi:hypothetical protein